MNGHVQGVVSTPAEGCANCRKPLAAAMMPEAVVYSQDGLAFCSGVCEHSYPKPIGGREFRAVLAAAAIAVVALTTFLLVCVVYRFRYLH
jgi:hypothetical protein